jgi:POT family proton-dependent oligopeptide transporter
MIWSIGILWVDQHVSLATPLGAVPASWFNSVDAFASIVAVPPLVALWRWQARRGREPGDVAKIGIGSALTGLSALILAAGAALAGKGAVAVWWPLIGFSGMGVAFLYYWPVLLALVSQAAPAKVNATLMGGAFLALFAGSVAMGWVGTFYDRMSPAAFWMLDAGIAFAGAMLVAILNRPLARALEPSDA